MKRLLACVIMLCVVVAAPARSEPVGTAFTYQGELTRNGNPYTGTANFSFVLFDAGSGGNVVGTMSPVALNVEAGLFTTNLDFGAVFNGDATWLEIQVGVPGEGYTVLTPRQRLNAAPYALRALSAPGGGSSQWGNSTYGIDYTAGNVGIGQQAHSGAKLNVNSGPSLINAARIFNNSASHACLYMGNSSNSWGIYDDLSGRHYFTGRFGLRTLNPEAQLHVSSLALGVKAEGTADGVTGTTDAAIWGVGYGSALLGTCAGIIGQSNYGNGMEGVTSRASSYGGYFQNTAGGTAFFADGKAAVRTLDILGGADIVEGFDTGGDVVEPGTVVVIDEEHPGQLRRARGAYDHRVAGVVSGAGGIAPGLRLGQEGVMDGETPIAMSGRVFVRCSAENGPIRPGDLLTTAETEGCAMRSSDPARSHGAVLGKAMTGLENGTGQVLVLVNLQ